MTLREATLEDIPQMQVIRNSVIENTLSDPGLITDADYVEFLTQRGKGWIVAADGEIGGFSIVDLQGHNVWALFIKPGHESKGYGRQLHDVMLNWYFAQTSNVIWLSTDKNTRAELFYRKAGWQEAGQVGQGETRFEMTKERWRS